ncbi:hypothetical protein SARC_02166 [Sphaeroforma arctica JP610]|uniref:Tetratricopeptide SHNi-TPR domain-containing protein n=1 Tax=Sphaeroforma arctica JP610 TaxID=667725 RepID=A0A0L0G9H6_9EUKA|nr:hypothetical protein SARC_02166 [Sphaeroforma arctica JP610]KNC85645.1 hypothetical protein SARC_02166 [Sphaeroforma arctica JP610]|eukprot:XP_014159547.1 hypothetical protein SARC_02166 [Sphaeroforma arctica JP610]
MSSTDPVTIGGNTASEVEKTEKNTATEIKDSNNNGAVVDSTESTEEKVEMNKTQSDDTKPVGVAETDDIGKGKAEDQTAEVEEEPKKQYTKEDLPKADHIRREAKLLYTNRDYSKAVEKYVEVLEVYTSVYGELGAECGELFLWYGDSLLQVLRENLQLIDDSEEFEDCWNVLEVARVIFERDAPKSSMLAMTHRKLGNLNNDVCEEYEKAIEDYKKAIALYEALPEKDDRAVAELHFFTGLSHSNLKAFAEARASYQKAAKILKRCLDSCVPTETKELQEIIDDLNLKIEDTYSMEKEHAEKEKIEQADNVVLKKAFQDAMQAGNVTLPGASIGPSSSGEGSSSTQEPSRATVLAPILTTDTPTAPIVDLTKLVRRAKATSISQRKDDNMSMIANANSSAGGSLVDGFGDGFAHTGPVIDLSSFVKRKKPVADINSLVKRKTPTGETPTGENNSSAGNSPKKPKTDVPETVAPGAGVDL